MNPAFPVPFFILIYAVMKKALCILLLFFFSTASLLFAQTYRYLGIENGLSNRRIYAIQKDTTGYMWFLTGEGIDRYDGKSIKQYRMMEAGRLEGEPFSLVWLQAQGDGLWAMGKAGRIFRYDSRHDDFELVYRLPKNAEEVSYAGIDQDGRIWLCNRHSIVWYDTRKGETRHAANPLNQNITDMEQIDGCRFFIATENGVRRVEMDGQAGKLHLLPSPALDSLHTQAETLCLHRPSGKLYIGTFEQGVLAYDWQRERVTRCDTGLGDVNITGIVPLDGERLLVATEGMGIHQIDTGSGTVRPYITSNFARYNEMNSDNITSLYVDGEQRLWVANYPEGITIIDGRHKNYYWIKHSVGNRQSIINDQVQAVIEDSDGDLWFGTSNGISLYHTATGEWTSFLSSYDHRLKDKNHIFITLCEAEPGVVWAGGYTSGLYKIYKASMRVEYFAPLARDDKAGIRPDKYIRDMVKDSQGNLWSGGYHNLKRINPVTGEVRLYPGIGSVTAMTEYDAESMWIGTRSGLYLLEKATGAFRHVKLQEYPTCINTLYQQPGNGILWVGTNDSGVIAYDPRSGTAKRYHKDNSALVTDIIYTILPERDGKLMMSTENGISCLDLETRKFKNWTKEQGLMSACFSAGSGALLRKGGFIFGSTDGAVMFPEGTTLPQYVYRGMRFTDLRISYQAAYPGDKGSPLTQELDCTEHLPLEYDQNSFSFRISTINYDAPNNTIFYWRLGDDPDSEWNKLNDEGVLQFTNLQTGKYSLHVRAVSKEEPYLKFEERRLYITIARPVWLGNWALAGYTLLSLLLLGVLYRIMELRKQKKISDEKTLFFTNTAHDIRTPLTLIKAPLEEMLENHSLGERETVSVNTALRNVDALLTLTTNLLNFERATAYSSRLHIAEHELNAYLEETCSYFHTYAAARGITFSYERNFEYFSAWFDKEKMDSILKNVLSNAMKYTPEGGTVTLAAKAEKEYWQLTVSDTGIGIPQNEQSKLFRLHFRGSNAVNAKITGSGIGLILVRKLVRKHGGKIKIESVERQGTTVQMTFPAGKVHFGKQDIIPVDGGMNAAAALMPSDFPEGVAKGKPSTVKGNLAATAGKGAALGKNSELPKILVVEDNDELRAYLEQALSGTYHVQACHNGREAKELVKELWPELVLSDIMMPEMRGDELCALLKSDMETSHIPVVLLTALGDEKSIVKGLQTGADDYITKPFSIRILKASIAAVLANRARLRASYQAGKLAEAVAGSGNGGDSGKAVPVGKDAGNGGGAGNGAAAESLDQKFISLMKRHVEEHIGDQNLSVDTLCALMGMSRTSLYHKLKMLTGQSPSDFIRTMRLAYAAELLVGGRCTVTEVAEQTGFCDSKYFREVFKKQFGVSPSQYKRE